MNKGVVLQGPVLPKGQSYTPLILYEFFSSSFFTILIALVDLEALSRSAPGISPLEEEGLSCSIIEDELVLWRAGGGGCAFLRKGLRITGILKRVN
jgi:hypothetical protein